MSDEITCMCCGGALEVGHLLDQGHGTTEQAQWQRGEPVHSFWTGVRVDRKQMLPITTYRCVECGHLEMFANPKPETGGG